MTGAVGRIGKEMIPLEIEPTRQAIKATLWSGNIKLARTLISKRVAEPGWVSLA